MFDKNMGDDLTITQYVLASLMQILSIQRDGSLLSLVGDPRLKGNFGLA